MTSDNQYHCLGGYCHLFERYYGMGKVNTVFCGFSPLPDLPYPEYDFFSIGEFESYPPGRWSDALMKVLNNIADEVFILMLSDFWLTRQVDINALDMIYDYMHQYQNVIKFDLTTERLYAEGGGKYLYGNQTYNTLGYLDLIKSSHQSAYHMSLWTGMWRRDLLKKVLVFGETAQQIELNGTQRLAQYGDEMLVLGTRQAPMLHANVIQAGQWNQDHNVGILALNEADRKELRELEHIE
jgi:hypothetical protein